MKIDTLGGRLHRALLALRQCAYDSERPGPVPAFVVVDSDAFDRLRDRLGADPRDLWIVAKPRRKKPDMQRRWFMLAGVRVVSAEVALDHLVAVPRCPLRGDAP